MLARSLPFLLSYRALGRDKSDLVGRKAGFLSFSFLIVRQDKAAGLFRSHLFY